MSGRDESLSTRDLASSPAEPRDEAQISDTRENAESAARDDDMTRAAELTPDAPAADESDHRRGERDADIAQPATGASRDATAPAAEPARDSAEAPLLAKHHGEEFGTRWEAIQVKFVDDPRRAVEEADELVANVMQQLAEGFARERESLEGQWSRGEDVSTEDLRVALQRYRSFFQRLLSA